MKNNSNVLKLTGIFGMIAGALYITIQFIHPADDITSVGTTLWMVIGLSTSFMSLSFLIASTGIFVKQMPKLGIIGRIGYLMFAVFWIISMIFSFNEAFIYPLLKTEYPEFVVSLLGLFNGGIPSVDIGIFPILAAVSGLMYVFGGLLLGIGTLKTGIFPKGATILFSVSSLVTITSSIIPHPFDRMLAIPLGISMILLSCELVGLKALIKGTSFELNDH